ncbi:MAG: hypothetical protein DMF63_06590 [Acidobacteria bacterium]|nr:MAG: hypothetical protein DMF63_06590 [Acidobacteriota bacterium]
MRSALYRAAAFFLSAFLILFCGISGAGQSRTNSSGTGGSNEIRGRIYLPSGQSFDTPVEVELKESFSSLKVFTDHGGTFVFQNLTPGSYTVVVHAGEQFSESREYVTIDPDVPPPRGSNAPVISSPKSVNVPIYLQLKRGVYLRNDVINAKWASIPKETLEHFKKGIELAQDNKNAEAEAELQKAVALSPTFAPAHTELGTVSLAQGRLDAAVSSSLTAIKYDDTDFEAHLNLGIAYLNQKKYDLAEPQLVTAAYLNRAAVRPHYYLGMLFVMKNDLDIAQKAFEKAIELNGGKSLPAIHKYLGRIYLKKDMEKEALRELETYIKLAPNAQDVEKVKKDISDIKAKLKNAFV